MKKSILFIFAFLGLASHAQQDAQYTQYMYNTININPAYAGSRGVLSVFGLHRNQWVGLDGAPVTNTFAINTPVNNSNIGLGLSFINDKLGVTSDNQISADVSYTIKTSETFKLSFGVKGTANLLSIDYPALSQYQNDALAYDNIDRRFSPNIGAGLYFHSDKTYLGLSVPNFLETKYFDDNKQSLASERMNFYFIAGHVFDINETIKFKPAVLSKLVQGAPLQVDLSGNFLFNDKFVLGGAYRWSAAASLMTGYQINKSWFIGYGYDLETTRLRNYNSGSHELFLRYELFNRPENIVSPRFF